MAKVEENVDREVRTWIKGIADNRGIKWKNSNEMVHDKSRLNEKRKLI